MEGRKIDATLMLLSVVSFLIMASTFLFMPFTSSDGEHQIYSIIIGASFWGFMIIGIVLQIILSSRRKKWLRKHHVKNGRAVHSKAGIICFAKNGLATITDAICGLSIIALIIVLVVIKKSFYISFIVIAIFAFTFCLHCILNGKNYYYITNRERIRAQQTKEEEKKHD